MNRAPNAREARLLRAGLDHPELFHRYVTATLARAVWRVGNPPDPIAEVSEAEGAAMAEAGWIRLMPAPSGRMGPEPYRIGAHQAGQLAYVTEAGAHAIGRAQRADILVAVAERRAARDLVMGGAA